MRVSFELFRSTYQFRAIRS